VIISNFKNVFQDGEERLNRIVMIYSVLHKQVSHTDEELLLWIQLLHLLVNYCDGVNKMSQIQFTMCCVENPVK